jgi:hypothetical protein
VTGDVIQARAGSESSLMYGFLRRDPIAKARAEYEARMLAAIELQRKGDIRGFAARSEDAATLERRLAELERSKK